MINEKTEIMKRTLLVSALLTIISVANGQKSIDRLFEKYSDREGYICITVSGNLLNIAASFEDEGDDKDIKARITEVRILARKDDDFNDLNFHDIVMRDIDTDDYEEFMRVKETDQDLRVMVKSQGKKITELLLISGGENNAIIQVRGNMTVSDARKMCDHARKNHGSDVF